MNDRRLDSHNDIFLVGTAVARNSDQRASVCQRIRTMVQTFKGECFSDALVGVPYYNDILGCDALASDAVYQYFKNAILDIPEVSSVDNLKLDISGRNLSVQYKVTLVGGLSAQGRTGGEPGEG